MAVVLCLVKKMNIKLLFLLLVSWSVHAVDTLSYSLYEIALPDLVRVVLDDSALASVVVSGDVLEDRKPVNFVLRNVTKTQAIEQLRLIVTERGLELVKLHDVYHLRKVVEPEKDFFVYRPKYRSVSYLSDLIGGLVQRQAVVSQRALPAQSGNAMGNYPAQQGYETGTNVNSLMDKSDKDVLVINVKPVDAARVKRMLEQVDKPIPEMLVKAVIMEVQTGAGEGSALNLLVSMAKSGLGSASVTWSGGADEKNAIRLKLGGIDALWSAINTDSRFKIVSAPQIRVKSGGSARFSVGADTPVLGAVNYQGNGQSVQSVEYKPSGVILDLKPEIRGELAELKVFQQLSSFAKTENGVNGSPTLLKRELTTTVVVGQNDVVMLGGLDEEKSQSDSAGFFFMPKIMQSISGSKSRSEIVLMLYVERVISAGESI